ncbi:hypothetical protein [Desulfovibrio inopinatus]|uniref:hypothetical protein n=1 Tax=Desulfovibrio inopinatus TaxID=102109 RepID=UPI00041FD353|nr:hypothetical protein [Desulfovibrio inopinatus]
MFDQIYTTAAHILFGVFIGFILLNVLAWALIQIIPKKRLVLSRDRIRWAPPKILSLYETGDNYTWFGLKSEEEFQAYWQESFPSAINIAYEAFSEFQHHERTGKYWNVSPHGFRHGLDQGPWPPHPDNYNIFFFGGSTAYHIGPDWTSIASQLQKNLGTLADKPVKVYNFGRCAFFSTQEKVLFLQLLSNGYTPDLALFLDGLNDSIKVDLETATSTLYKELLRERSSQQKELSEFQLQSKTRWIRLKLFLLSLPVTRLLEKGMDLLSPAEVDDAVHHRQKYTAYSSTDIDKIVHRILTNYQQIVLLADHYGVTPFFVVQPVPAYKYDLRYHQGMVYGLGLNEAVKDVYPQLLPALKNSSFAKNTIDLSAIQEGSTKNHYIDEAHYTAPFANEIALQIAENIKQHPLLQRENQRK